MAGKFEEKLGLDVSEAISGVEKVAKKITGVVEDIKTLRGLKATANVDVDVDDSDVAELEKDIAAVDGKSVDLNVNVKAPSKSFDALITGLGIGVATKGLDLLGEGFSSTLKLGQEFETGLASLSAVTGATGPLLTTLGGNAQRLAESFGGSASEQLGIFQVALSKIGPQLAQSPKDLETFANSVNLLSKTDSALGAAGAVDALSGSMLQFGVNVKDSAEVARESERFINVLAASAGVGSATVAQVSEAIAVAGATAKNSGVSFEETNAALQVLASKSLVGSQAGTGLATVLNKLTAQSGEGDDALKKLGTSSQELGALLNTGGIGAAVGKLRESMEKLGTQAEKNALLNKLFGEGGQNAAAALLGGGDMLAEFTAGVTGTSAATDQAATNMATFSEKISRLVAGIQNFAISIYQALVPVFSALIDNAEILLPVVIGLAAGLVVYAAGAAAAAISTALASVAGLTFNAVLAANPIGAVIVAVIALTAGVMLLADALEQTAEEQLAVTETQIAATKSQIEDNEAKKKGVVSTQAMVKEYKELANKTALTAKEQERMRVIQNQLDSQYPDLIDQTKSFRDNLDGVEKAGIAVTASMEGLTKEGIKLGEQLKEQTKLLAFVKRNVEIQKLEDILGIFDTSVAEVKAKKAIEKFKDAIQKAQNEAQVQAARGAIGDLLNSVGLGNEELLELSAGVTAVVNAQIAAINLAKGIKPIEAATATPTPTPTAKPVPKADGDADKKAKTALEVQQEKLKLNIAERAQQLLNLQAKNAELVTLDKLTAKEAKLEEAVLRTKLAEENRLQAVDLLKAKLNEEGVVIATSIRLAEGESLNAIKDTIQGLSNALRADKQNVLQLQTDISKEELGKQIADALDFANELAGAKFFNFDESTLKQFIDKGIEGLDGFSDFVAKRVAELDAQINILGKLAEQQNKTEQAKTLTDLEKLQTARLAILNKAALAEIEVREGVAKKLKEENVLGTALIETLASFKIEIDNEAANKALEETQELIAGVNKEFASGELTYQQAMEKLKDVSKEQSVFMEAVAASVAKSGQALSDTLEASALKAIKAGDTAGEAAGFMAASVGASFVSLAASGENVFIAIAKAAFDGLQALVPVISATILGLSLAGPDSVLTGGTVGLAKWTAMTAILGLAVAAARAGLGFKDGGPTGDNIGANQVAGVVHGKEFVAPERMYAKHGDLLKHLYANRELSSFPEIQTLMKQNQIIPMRDIALNMGGGSQSITVNAMAGDALKPLQDELQGVRRQLVAMETLHKSSSDIMVTADEGYHARRARRSAIKGARN